MYGVLVNASAVHGAPIFMNLVNSAALQAVVDAVGVRSGQGDGQGQGSPGDAAGGAGGAAAGAGGSREKELPRCAFFVHVFVFA